MDMSEIIRNSPLELRETLEQMANIDACYYSLQQISEELNAPRTPIDVMIDQATGAEADKNRKAVELGIYLSKQIVAAKKKIDCDYSGDQDFINTLENTFLNRK